VIVRVIVALAVLAASGTLSLWWRRREGRMVEAHGVFDRRDLGIGSREQPCATIVEFYGEGCAPCVTVEERLEKVAETVCDLRVIKLDAGERLDLADRYNVKRVPTIFVTDPDLKIVWRASGVPTEEAIMVALLGPEWAGRPRPEQPVSALRNPN
jgi:thiol-disulfide isomerase/thioredoxin